MKQPQTLALTAILAVAVGMVGFNGVQGDLFASNTDVAGQEGTAMLGHVVATHTDKDGNVLSYSQSDNVITFTGKNCAANLLFGTGFGNCTSPAVFANIAVSPTTLATVDIEDATTALLDECALVAECGDGLELRNGAGVTVAANTVGSDGVNAIVSISATFTKVDAVVDTIRSAGLFDTSAVETGNVFAVQNFGTAVPLDIDESLKVDWLITLQAPLT